MVLASCVEEKNLYNPDEGTPEDTQLGLSTDFLLKRKGVYLLLLSMVMENHRPV